MSDLTDIKNTIDDAVTLLTAYSALLAEIDRLRTDNARLQADIADLCPVGDLVGFPAWQTEKALMQEELDRLQAELERTRAFLAKMGWQP